MSNIPNILDSRKNMALLLKPSQYQFISRALLRRNVNNVLLQCLEKEEYHKVLSSLHEHPTGGHFGPKTTMQKRLRSGYYWPTLFKDAYIHVRRSTKC